MQTKFEPRSEAEASALRVFSANGFGAAVTGDVGPTFGRNLYHRVSAERSYQLAEIVAASLLAVVGFARRLAADFQRWQRARATYLALRDLDARILHDLGFHRSELMSVAAEVAGRADFTRARLTRVV
jgi:uncharacterized protein YjiS (DUF1127 family)